MWVCETIMAVVFSHCSVFLVRKHWWENMYDHVSCVLEFFWNSVSKLNLCLNCYFVAPCCIFVFTYLYSLFQILLQFKVECIWGECNHLHGVTIMHCFIIKFFSHLVCVKANELDIRTFKLSVSDLYTQSSGTEIFLYVSCFIWILFGESALYVLHY